jgi:hypothetical protein
MFPLTRFPLTRILSLARYPNASERELADDFMEELRNDEALRKTVLEEVFELMSSGLERTWRKE